MSAEVELRTQAGTGYGPRKVSQRRKSYRPEVQGLRALAVLMVVTYHIWFGRVSGGVDVFLLISAFLLTLSFVRKIEAGDALDLGRYWLHLFKRLLPAAVVVMLATLAASFVLVPATRWHDILEQTWASVSYVQNWLLASNSVDYYAADHSEASPLQHFWSLSIQGQVFILWPLLFGLCAIIAKAARLRFRAVVVLVFGALFAASFSFSIMETYSNQAHAYFDTRTRLWEFALGTLLALALPYLRLPRRLRIVAGWLGVSAMLSGGFLLDVEREFPGYIALWPLLAAGLVILAGQTGSPIGVDRFLSWKPLVRLGDMSYALYLWHWPLLVIYLIAQGRSEAGPLSGSAIIIASLALAYLTTKFVEKPVRDSVWAGQRRRRAALVAISCWLIVAIPLTAWQQGLRLEAERLDAQSVANNPGARVLSEAFSGNPAPDTPTIPLAAEIQGEWAALPGRCDEQAFRASGILEEHCTDNVLDGAPTRTMVVVGDSHAEQWLGAIEPLAQDEGWKLVALLKGGCDFGAPAATPDQECAAFNTAALEYVKALDPDLVFTVATDAHPDDAQDTVVPGYSSMAKDLGEHGMKVIGIRDNPRYAFNMMECLDAERGDVSRCSKPRDRVLNGTPPFDEVLQVAPSAGLIDATDLICGRDECGPVVGNMHVYIDDNHLTETYVGSMYPALGERIKSAAGW
ncbi:acyltransferase family protein [Arthrobacter sp. H5]|uniref:acyltransferase family protein n=1 Tax=Arthrobacter sp. H5 TaxID=1267973 RepID=UPI0004B272CA|nr:acyltransferase family protein [Arthrobacter sp. H5]